jgi:hypothetical protein
MADNEVTRVYFVFIVFVEDIKLYFDKELLPTIKDILNPRKIQKNDWWVVMLFEYSHFFEGVNETIPSRNLYWIEEVCRISGVRQKMLRFFDIIK